VIILHIFISYFLFNTQNTQLMVTVSSTHEPLVLVLRSDYRYLFLIPHVHYRIRLEPFQMRW